MEQLHYRICELGQCYLCDGVVLLRQLTDKNWHMNRWSSAEIDPSLFHIQILMGFFLTSTRMALVMLFYLPWNWLRWNCAFIASRYTVNVQYWKLQHVDKNAHKKTVACKDLKTVGDTIAEISKAVWATASVRTDPALVDYRVCRFTVTRIIYLQ